MSIRVQDITKIYGEQKALDQVSFAIVPGQIVGFLGPNGAGKSTMMKILTCFIPPTSGTAVVDGYDIFQNPIEVRRIIGYLPENNPLYPEMYVREYLEFTGGIYKIGNLKARIDEMIEMTGLTAEYKKKIATLSKGYRQRVGLAQALIHDPRILILDEPTSGLDPNQIAEIRNLIRNLGREKTVMLSTHIMQEVESICDSVIIIHKGRIVANDTTRNLQSFGKQDEILVIEFDQPVGISQFTSLPHVKSADQLTPTSLRFTCAPGSDGRQAILKLAADLDLTLQSLQKQESSLEEIFRNLTKN